MHQTFYIDIDEEITSIVDRLRKAKSKEVVIVVPKRAILIQSIVNLKLLKKEADGLGKELIIVTQDKFGKMLIEKAGIAVEQKLDDVDGDDEVIEAEKESVDDLVKINVNSSLGEPKEIEARKRVDKIGSDGYYQAESLDDILGGERYIKETEKSGREAENTERITNKELVIDVGDDLRRQKSSFSRNSGKKGFAPMDLIRNIEISENEHPDEGELKIADNKIKKSKNLFRREKIQDNIVDEPETKKVEKFFEQTKKNNIDEYRSINVGNNLKKYFAVFSLIALAAILGASAYLFLPKATVTVFAKKKIQSADLQISGQVNATSIDLSNEIVPAKIISVSEELSATYGATGEKTSSNQKAKGTITIYNEFSSSPQPLVATTRFESADKKIFRLISGVTVPGIEGVGGQTKPGAIEAEVIADEAGAAYNIEPTSFTIPGFQSSGNEKYTKIYAKSFKAMIGGGEGNEMVTVVTDADVNSAKTKVFQNLQPVLNKKLKEAAGEGYVLLDDAINLDNSAYTLSNSSGDVAKEFTVTVKTAASAIVFRSEDVKNIAASAIAKKSGNGDVASNSVNVEFGKSDADFKDGSIIIRVHGSGNILPKINLDEIKSGIVGKNEVDLGLYLNTYSDIERIEVDYWPSFLSGKIPSYASRIEVVLDKN